MPGLSGKRGAFDYVSKPFDWEYLHRCVGAALTGASAIPAGAAQQRTA